MLIGLTPARTDFFTGFMLKKNSKKLLHLFLNLVFLKKVFEVTLFYGSTYIIEYNRVELYGTLPPE